MSNKSLLTEIHNYITQHTSRLSIQGYHRNVVETKESFWRSWAAGSRSSYDSLGAWEFWLGASESDETTLEVCGNQLGRRNENAHGHGESTSPWEE